MGGRASADSKGVGPLTRQQDTDPVDYDQKTADLELGLKVLSAVDHYSADGADELSVAAYARLPRSTARFYLLGWEQMSMVERDPETGRFRIPMSRRTTVTDFLGELAMFRALGDGALAEAVKEAMAPDDSGEFSVDDRDIDSE